MEPETDSEYDKVQYKFNSNMGDPMYTVQLLLSQLP